jgi:hypothetical protein
LAIKEHVFLYLLVSGKETKAQRDLYVSAVKCFSCGKIRTSKESKTYKGCRAWQIIPESRVRLF